MSDDKDEGTRVGLWVIAGVVGLVVAGILGGIVMRSTGNKAVAANETLIEGPLTGVLAGVIYFDSGKATIDGTPPALAEAVKSIQAQTGKTAVLAGFHDATGDPAKNAELAKDRAKAVRAAMTALGVDLTSVRLRKPEQTDGGTDLQAARRVEIRVVDAVK